MHSLHPKLWDASHPSLAAMVERSRIVVMVGNAFTSSYYVRVLVLSKLVRFLLYWDLIFKFTWGRGWLVVGLIAEVTSPLLSRKYYWVNGCWVISSFLCNAPTDGIIGSSSFFTCMLCPCTPGWSSEGRGKLFDARGSFLCSTLVVIRQGWEERNGRAQTKAKEVVKERGRLATSLTVGPVNTLAVMAGLIDALLLARVPITVGPWCFGAYAILFEAGGWNLAGTARVLLGLQRLLSLLLPTPTWWKLCSWVVSVNFIVLLSSKRSNSSGVVCPKADGAR